MSIQETLNKIAEKIPLDGDQKEAVNISRTPLINIAGLLTHKTDDSIIIAMGGSEIAVQVVDIMSVEENESRPAGSVEWPFITITVPATATVKLTRSRLAGQLGLAPGSRPFVYDLPSTTSQFAVTKEEYDRRQRQWMDRVGLPFNPLDYTFTMTESHTTKPPTTYNTTTNTTDPDGTSSADSVEDSKSDDQQDYNEDMKDDGDGDIFRAMFRVI